MSPRAPGHAESRAPGIALEDSMRIRRSAAGRHRKPARAILPVLITLGVAGSALTGVAAAAAATHVSTMHYHGRPAIVRPMMHYHG
jgi:hypothetical protein